MDLYAIWHKYDSGMDWGYGVSASISENFNLTSWALNLNEALPGENYNQLASNLGTFRPAGVPFTPFYIATGGNYISVTGVPPRAVSVF